MSDALETAPTQAGLTEIQRCVDIFTAPSKTFTDLRRKATFWGPLLVMIVVATGFGFTVQQKVGWERVFQNNVNQTPAKAEKIESAPNAEQIKAISAKFTAGATYGYWIIVLLITLVTSLLYWVTINYGFGGTAKYGQIYAVSLYASLVMNIKFLLGIVALFAGLAPDSFLIQNPVGSNVGYYLSADSPLWLRSLCTHLDVFEIWALVLTVIGVAVVAKVSKGKAAAVVVGWWVVFVIITAGIAAAGA